MQEVELNLGMEFLGLGEFFVCGKVDNIYGNVSIREYFEKLCAKVECKKKCKDHLDRAQAATQAREWDEAYREWTSFRNVVHSQDLLNEDEGPLLLVCHALVSANFSAFHSKKFGLALTDAILASKEQHKIQNVQAASGLESYVERTLLKVMYLWASTADCGEEKLDLGHVKAFLIERGHPRDSMSDPEVGTLKQQCKKFVINKSKSVVWEIQNYYFNYSNTEECLRWAREGNKLYEDSYPGKLDYVSKLNEAFTLFMSGAFERATEVGEKIIHVMNSETWDGKAKDVHPAGQYCNPQYKFLIHLMQSRCYWHMAVQSDAGNLEKNKLIDRANKQNQEWQSRLIQMEATLHSRSDIGKYLSKAWEDAVNKYVEYTSSKSVLFILHSCHRRHYLHV
jgi:hypothetical protein